MIMMLELIRSKNGFGELLLNGEHLAYTVEQPWNDNKPFVSCVPVGTYDLIQHQSTKYGDVFALYNPDLDVFHYPDDRENNDQRYACLFVHKGNYPRNFEGCIGTGNSYMTKDDVMGEVYGVTNTKDTCEAVLEAVRQSGETKIIIRNE